MTIDLIGRQVLALTMLCGACEAADDAPDEGSIDSEGADTDDLSCVERLESAQADGFCGPGTVLAFAAGGAERDSPPEFELVEFEGGRYQRGYDPELGEFFYSDDGCFFACRRTPAVTQAIVCQAVDEDGNPGCTFATSNELTLEACIDFVDACG